MPAAETLFALPYGPILIFLLRAVDVSLGTLRMILMTRGRRSVAAALGFVEVLIWVVAAGNALMHLDSPFHVVAYAAGFATGNYLGVTLEEKIALGTMVVRVIVPSTVEDQLADRLRALGYRVTEVDGRGRSGSVEILNLVVKRKVVPEVMGHVERLCPEAFATVEEVRTSRMPVRPVLPTPRR